MIGFTDVDTVSTEQGITLTFEMTGRLYLEGEADINDWTFTGEPELHLSNPAVPTAMTTVTQLVNRIPDVINAPPGFVTDGEAPAPALSDLPARRLRDRTRPGPGEAPPRLAGRFVEPLRISRVDWGVDLGHFATNLHCSPPGQLLQRHQSGRGQSGQRLVDG